MLTIAGGIILVLGAFVWLVWWEEVGSPKAKRAEAEWRASCERRAAAEEFENWRAANRRKANEPAAKAYERAENERRAEANERALNAIQRKAFERRANEKGKP
jgi:hypothetical protein